MVTIDIGYHRLLAAFLSFSGSPPAARSKAPESGRGLNQSQYSSSLNASSTNSILPSMVLEFCDPCVAGLEGDIGGAAVGDFCGALALPSRLRVFVAGNASSTSVPITVVSVAAGLGEIDSTVLAAGGRMTVDGNPVGEGDSDAVIDGNSDEENSAPEFARELHVDDGE